MLPAHQCLCAAQTNIISDLWLVIEDKLAAGDCLAQFCLERRPSRDRGSHLGLEEAQGVAPRCLGLVHGKLGAFQWLFDILALRAAKQGDADAGGAVMPMSLDLVGLTQ